MSLQLFCQEDGHHCLALAWPTRDPQQARVIAVITITIVVVAQPRQIFCVVCNPLAGAYDSRAFRADNALAVDVGIGEEERVATRRGRLFVCIYQMPVSVIVNSAEITESNSPDMLSLLAWLMVPRLTTAKLWAPSVADVP